MCKIPCCIKRNRHRRFILSPPPFEDRGLDKRGALPRSSFGNNSCGGQPFVCLLFMEKKCCYVIRFGHRRREENVLLSLFSEAQNAINLVAYLLITTLYRVLSSTAKFFRHCFACFMKNSCSRRLNENLNVDED